MVSRTICGQDDFPVVTLRTLHRMSTGKQFFMENEQEPPQVEEFRQVLIREGILTVATVQENTAEEPEPCPWPPDDPQLGVMEPCAWPPDVGGEEGVNAAGCCVSG